MLTSRLTCCLLKMPSFSQEINVDLNSNEKDEKNEATDGKTNEEARFVAADQGSESAPEGLNTDQRLSYALRDFLGSSNAVISDSEGEPSPLALEQGLPFIDEPVDAEDVTQSDDERPLCRDTEEVLNNAACRLRRWRAASRKLRRPRIIDNLCGSEDKKGAKSCNGHTDLADRLRNLAVAGSMSASAGELLSLAPPPPAATAPPSPGCLLSPSLADQTSAEYFVSTITHNTKQNNL